MSVLVDTSARVEFLRATGGPHHLWLRDAIEREVPLAWTDPILFELMAGALSVEHANQTAWVGRDLTTADSLRSRHPTAPSEVPLW